MLRTDVSGDPTFGDLLGRVRAAVLGAVEHEDLPFQVLVRDIAQGRKIARRDVIPLLLVFEHAVSTDDGAAGLSSAVMPATAQDREAIFSTFDLIVEISEGPPVSVLLKYDADIFDDATGARMLRQFIDLLEQVAERPDLRLSALAIAPPA